MTVCDQVIFVIKQEDCSILASVRLLVGRNIAAMLQGITCLLVQRVNKQCT